jgi:hypothetical protein
MRARSTTAFAALVLAVALATASCASYPEVDPAWIRPDNRPTTVPGASNGELPEADLVTIDPHCRIATAAAPSLRAMLADASADGVELAPEECYRDYAGQVYWWNLWCYFGHCENAAVPGTSNHGWAKAVDLKDQEGEVTFGSPGWVWLRANAGRYGWNWPWPSTTTFGAEAWHFEWVGDGGQLFPDGAPTG